MAKDKPAMPLGPTPDPSLGRSTASADGPSASRPARPWRVPIATAAVGLCLGMAAWLSLGVLAVVDDGGRRIGVLPPLWLLVVFVVLAALARGRLRAGLGVPLLLASLALLPWLPVPIPDLFLAWTGPVVWLLWGAIGSTIVLVAASGRRIIGPRWLRDPRPAPRVAAVLAFTVFLAVHAGHRSPPAGDEPHYLLLAQSLLADGDIDVANNYARGDQLSYFPGPLEPHLSRPGVHGEAYSIHAPGLPALIVPAFALAGYRGVVVWIALLVAIGSALIWRGAFALTGDAGSAWFGWAATTLTAPLVLHGSLVFPDPLAGVALSGGVLALVVASRRARESHAVGGQAPGTRSPWPVWASLFLGLAVGTLPWLHTRLALPGAILGLLLLLRISSSYRAAARWLHLVAFLIPVVAGVGAWFAFFKILYGTFNPGAPYNDTIPLSAANLATGLAGLVVDQEFGIVPSAPVAILWLGGLWSVLRKDRRLGIELLLVTAPYAMASAAYSMWWAGASPPARLLVPVAGPAGVGLAALWSRQDARGRAMSSALLGASILLAAALSFGGGGGLAYNRASGRARLLDWLSPLIDLPLAFPSFFRTAAGTSAPGSDAWHQLIAPAAWWGPAIWAGWTASRSLGRWSAAARRRHGLVAVAVVLAVGAVGAGITWRTGAHLQPTRAQLAFLEGDDPARRPIAVQPFPLRLIPASRARSELALTTSPLEAPRPGALLFLTEVPPGRYEVRVRTRGSALGTLALGIGRASETIERWPVGPSGTSARSLSLPVTASMVTVRGDDDAMRSVRGVALVPLSRIAEAGPAGARARDAARYGSVVVLAIDDRVWLEPNGFWVMGERQPEVVVTTDGPARTLELDLRSAPVPNRVRVWSGRWRTERDLGPDEHWRVTVPIAPGAAAAIGFKVDRGVRIGGRFLGCRVEVQ